MVQQKPLLSLGLDAKVLGYETRSTVTHGDGGVAFTLNRV